MLETVAAQGIAVSKKVAKKWPNGQKKWPKPPCHSLQNSSSPPKSGQRPIFPDKSGQKFGRFSDLQLSETVADQARKWPESYSRLDEFLS